mgnify:FL=1|jgi:hypothetical protein
MKVKVVITKEQEMEIENSASLAVLHKWWKTHPATDWKDCPNELVKKAIKEVEEATGLPFGCDDVPETISAVLTGNNDAILEW